MKRKVALLLIALWTLGGTGCKTVNHVAQEEVSDYRISQTDVPARDSNIQGLIDPYKEALDTVMNRVIGHFGEDMIRARPESNLGNWFADIIAIQAEKYFDVPIDFATQNYGGIRRPTVAAGPITIGTVYEMMPFDNKIVVMTMDSAQVMTMLDFIASKGGWPINEGVSFEIVGDKAQHATLHGEQINSQRLYRIALPDYIANGGDNAKFLLDLPRQTKSILIRDAIIEYLEGTDEVQIRPVQGRITIKD